MLLTISTTQQPATELADILHHDRDRVRTIALSCGTATVFCPEATDDRCTIALVVEADPTPSALSNAVAEVFAEAMSEPRRAEDPRLPLEIVIAAAPTSRSRRHTGRLFRRLGWTAAATAIEVDGQVRQRGERPWVRLSLEATLTPAEALDRLCASLSSLDAELEIADDDGELLAKRYPSTGQRYDAVLSALDEIGARSVIDLGCGPGLFLERLAERPQLTRIVGVDVSQALLERAANRLGDKLADDSGLLRGERVQLLHGALTYADERFAGFDAAVLVEVVEHVDPQRLPALEHVVFGGARPRAVVVTTPNCDYRVEGGRPSMRHPDHRFEWDGAEFLDWCKSVGDRHGYDFEIRAVGKRDAAGVTPTQMAVFTRGDDPDGDGLGESVPAPPVPGVVDVKHVAGPRSVRTKYAGTVHIGLAGASAAMEELSRFGVDPRWLLYLPPTVAPCAASGVPGYVEHPEAAFDEYAAAHVRRVVCEELRTGWTRAIAVIARDRDVAVRRFQVCDGTVGALYSSTGRPVAADADTVVDRLRHAAQPLFESLQTSWLMLECELVPTSRTFAPGQQTAPTGAADSAGLAMTAMLLGRAAGRGLDVAAIAARTERRIEAVEAFRAAALARRRVTADVIAPTVSPVRVLAVESSVLLATKRPTWHLAQLARIHGDGISAPRGEVVDLTSATARSRAVDWWMQLNAAGGGGEIVVRPASRVGRLVQPGLLVRGREQLRLVHEPDCTIDLDPVRPTDARAARAGAALQHALAMEALRRFVSRQPLGLVHEAVSGTLALQLEPTLAR